jgi:hypothetical protein
MERNIDVLLDLRREAEKAARIAMELAATKRSQADQVQARLEARVRGAQDALGRARTERPSKPGRVSEAAMREAYLGDLARKAARAAAAAEAHRSGALAEAIAAEEEARAVHEKARLAAAAIARIKERAETREDSLDRRREEDAASDLASAAFVRRRRR